MTIQVTLINSGAIAQAKLASNTANAAFNQANNASNTANAALASSNANGVLIAQSAYAQANSQATYANGALIIANVANINFINTSTVNTAITANGSQQTNAGFTVNVTAVVGPYAANANAAYTEANNAYGQANAAYGQANAAYTAANTAFTTATQAYGQANTAYNQANTATTAAAAAANTVQVSANGGSVFAKQSINFINTTSVTVQVSPGTAGNTNVAFISAGSGGSVTNVANGVGIQGGPITTSGTLSANLQQGAIPVPNGNAGIFFSNNAVLNVAANLIYTGDALANLTLLNPTQNARISLNANGLINVFANSFGVYPTITIWNADPNLHPADQATASLQLIDFQKKGMILGMESGNSLPYFNNPPLSNSNGTNFIDFNGYPLYFGDSTAGVNAFGYMDHTTGQIYWYNPVNANASPTTNTITRTLTGLSAYTNAGIVLTSTASLTAEGNLTLTVNETGTYRIDAFLAFYANVNGNSAGGFQFDLGGGTAQVSSIIYGTMGWLTQGAVAGGSSLANTTGFAYSIISSTNTQPSWVTVDGQVTFNVAGTFAPRWCQANSSANGTTLAANSSLRLTKIG